MARPRKIVPDLYWLDGEGQYAANTGPGRTRRRYGPDREEAGRKYRADAAKLLAGEDAVAPGPASVPQTVGDLAERYLASRKGLVSPSQLLHVATVCGVLADLFNDLPAPSFGAAQVRQLKAHLLSLEDARNPEGACVKLVREMLLEENPRPVADVTDAAREKGFAPRVCAQARKRLGATSAKNADGVWMLSAPPGKLEAPARRKLSRRYVNSLLGLVRTMWKRLASDGLAAAAQAAEVCCVRNCEEGQGRETSPRLPVQDIVIDAVLPHLSPVVRAMLTVQRLTGMRPGEVCRMKRGELSLTPAEVVHLRIGDHLVPVSALEAGGKVVWAYVPEKHKGSRRKKPKLVALGPLAQQALGPYVAGMGPGDHVFVPPPVVTARKKKPARPAGPRYTPASYSTAVRRACRRALVPEFTAYMVRHSAATEMAQTEDPADVQAVLGHSSPAMTMHYVAQLLKRAAGVAARSG